MANLLIVESPFKARKIHFLLKQHDPNSEFVVVASYGHVYDLPYNEIGINFSAGFEPSFVVSNKKSLSNILKKVPDYDTIYIGSDDDREGEGIAWHLSNAILGRFPDKTVKRVRFHEITAQAVLSGIASADTVNVALVESYLTRRILDRMIGYSISPVLWSWVGRKLSAGRVQSSVLKILADIELSRKKFLPTQHWFCSISLNDGTILKTSPLASEKLANDVLASVSKGKFGKPIVTSENHVHKTFPPYTTASLIKAGTRVLKYSSDYVMWLAQQMYEDGLITYHRTDSIQLSANFVSDVRSYLTKNVGHQFLSDQPKWLSYGYKGAHEAIRPVNLKILPQTVRKDLQDLYRLIWRQAVASQGADAVLEEQLVKLTVMVNGIGVKFSATATRTVFPGHYQLRGTATFVGISSDSVDVSTAKSYSEYTKPEARLSEYSLIDTLENLKIGRPSTYVSTVKGLLDNYLIKRINKHTLAATQKGILISNFLSTHFPELTTSSFTAEMEKKLDEVSEESGMKRLEVLQEYWSWLEPKLKLSNAWILCYEPCPKCGAELEVTMQESSEPFLFCNDKRKPVAHNIPGLPPTVQGCGSFYGIDLGPSGEVLLFKPHDVVGKCSSCGASDRLKRLSGKYGLYTRCTACNQIVNDNED